MASAFRVPLNLPRPAAVRTDREGVPTEVDGRVIEVVRESWLVEDRWWTPQPLRRRYWEAVTTGGRNVVVFRDLTTGARAGAVEHKVGHPVTGGWFVQGS